MGTGRAGSSEVDAGRSRAESKAERTLHISQRSTGGVVLASPVSTTFVRPGLVYFSQKPRSTSFQEFEGERTRCQV